VANLWYAVVYVLTLTNRIARIRQRCSKKKLLSCHIFN
jgi:hypothetical protein